MGDDRRDVMTSGDFNDNQTLDHDRLVGRVDQGGPRGLRVFDAKVTGHLVGADSDQ